MLDQIFGGTQMIMGGVVHPKMMLLALLFLIAFVIAWFSVIPIGSYPGYAIDKTFQPAYFTGFSAGFILLLISQALKM
jgi:hypothetical protein